MSRGERQQRRREDRATAKEEQQAATEEAMEERASLLKALKVVPGRISSPASKIRPDDPYVFKQIQGCIRRTSVIQELHDILRTHPGVPSKLAISTMFHGMIAANWEKHSFLRTDVATVLNRNQLPLARELGLLDDDGEFWLSYPTFHKQQRRLEKLLRETWSVNDFDGLLNRLECELVAAGVPPEAAAQVVVVAIDETPFIAWYVTTNYEHQDEVNAKVGQEYRKRNRLGSRAPVPDMSTPEMRALAAEMGHTLGEDGRLQRTKAPDPRAMHISATNKDSSKSGTGWQSTKAVTAADFSVARNSDKLTLGNYVGSYTLASHTYPGNTDCGHIGLEVLLRARQVANGIEHVIIDRGFGDKEDSLVLPAIEDGLKIHRDYRSPYVHTHFPAIVEHSDGEDTVVESCGQVYHRFMPQNLRDVPEGLTGDDLAHFQAARQQWAYDRETDKSLPKGAFRYRCPFQRGKIYNEALPHSVSARRANARRVAIPDGETQCCHQCSFVDSEHRFAKYQYPHYGTLAHTALLPKRNPVEGKFGDIKTKHGLTATSCRARDTEAHVLASICIDVVRNLQTTMNKKIKALWAHQDAKRSRKSASAARKDQQAPNDGREMAEPDGRDSSDEEAPEDSDDESSAETPLPPRAPP